MDNLFTEEEEEEEDEDEQKEGKRGEASASNPIAKLLERSGFVIATLLHKACYLLDGPRPPVPASGRRHRRETCQRVGDAADRVSRTG